MARRVPDPGMPVSFIEGTAVSIFLDDQSVDTVVTTCTLRTIPGGCGDCRNAARTQTCRQAAVRRTWIGTRCRCGAGGRTGSHRSGVALGGDRLHGGPEADDVQASARTR